MGDFTQAVTARGHEHVTARHESTLEVTTDDWLTPAGDCILGIEADVAPTDFDPAFTARVKSRDARVRIVLRVGTRETTIHAAGHPELTYESDRSMVVRTSDHIDDRTVAIRSDTAAADVDREIVAELADGAELTCLLTVR